MRPHLSADGLADVAGIAHGFFTRHGGVSAGIYASLNCGLGSSDDVSAVRENRTRVVATLGAESLVTAYQVHGTTVVNVETPWREKQWPHADAMVTATPGIALGVLTADCAPVLFADPEARIVGAAHAGWRGALAGVLEATLVAMEALGAHRSRIRAAVGPCIGQPAYEVGWDFEKDFLAQDRQSARYFSYPQAGARPHFDLAGYAAHRLVEAGVRCADNLDTCTFARSEAFFSYRRSQARKDPDYGRQISAIVLT